MVVKCSTGNSIEAYFQLASHGVRLLVDESDGSKIKASAPPGTLNADLRSLVVEHKTGLLELLKGSFPVDDPEQRESIRWFSQYVWNPQAEGLLYVGKRWINQRPAIRSIEALLSKWGTLGNDDRIGVVAWIDAMRGANEASEAWAASTDDLWLADGSIFEEPGNFFGVARNASAKTKAR